MVHLLSNTGYAILGRLYSKSVVEVKETNSDAPSSWIAIYMTLILITINYIKFGVGEQSNPCRKSEIVMALTRIELYYFSISCIDAWKANRHGKYQKEIHSGLDILGKQSLSAILDTIRKRL